MLAYHIVNYAPYQPDVWAAEGIDAHPGETLHWQVERPSTNAPVVVVDTRMLPSKARAQGYASTLPPEALCNVSPYRPPVALRAAGGYVTPATPQSGVPVVLTIYRRGVWDLPKGKQDPGERIRACARREVCEEVGIDTVRIRAPLGITSHGYETSKTYVVKTTHWFLMHTDACTFTPQAQERIERVAWARWPVLRSHIGYDSLHHHMRTVARRVAHLIS